MPRLSYSKVVATIALFVALGGGVVYAANKIGPKEIKKNAVRAKHIKDGHVRAPEVDEASLSKVPRAARADRAGDADAVGGIRVTPITGAKEEGASSSTLLAVGGSTFRWSCGVNGPAYAYDRLAGAPPMVIERNEPGTVEVFRLQAGGGVSGDSYPAWAFTATVREASGRTTILEVNAFEEDDAFGGVDDCFVQGELRRFG